MRQGGLTVISAHEAVSRCYAEVVAKGKQNAAAGALEP
jgi:hypothetical protein